MTDDQQYYGKMQRFLELNHLIGVLCERTEELPRKISEASNKPDSTEEVAELVRMYEAAVNSRKELISEHLRITREIQAQRPNDVVPIDRLPSLDCSVDYEGACGDLRRMRKAILQNIDGWKRCEHRGGSQYDACIDMLEGSLIGCEKMLKHVQENPGGNEVPQNKNQT